MPPKFSIIVVCLNSADVRERCLQALVAQVESDIAEIIAVGHWDSDETRFKPDREPSPPNRPFPSVRALTAPAEYTVPQMRAQAIQESRGEIVILLEDDCVVPQGWMAQLQKAHSEGYKIVGGAIAAGNYRRLLDWAVYFCEYARFMPQFSGIQNALPGNHVSYERTVLPSLKPGDGFYEVFYHDQWRSTGGELFADPKLYVTNVNHWSSRHITTSPFHHGRAFAGMRSAGFPFWRKVIYAVLSFALPLVKAYRLAVVVFSRRRYTIQFLMSLPWSMLFLVSWSLGELTGYASGPGRSAQQWR